MFSLGIGIVVFLGLSLYAAKKIKDGSSGKILVYVFIGVAAGLVIIGLGMVVNMFTPTWNPRLNTKIS